MRIFANKKHLYSLAVGCAVFLCIGIRVQNAKAIEPSAEWMEGYWKDNPEIFQKTFEELFQKADSLNPLLDSLPNAFTTGRENFCTTYTIKNVCETGSCTEALARLEQDVSLKKIFKVLGSREFLARILTHATVDCIPPRDA